MRQTTFIADGQFYKGNLHCHSTLSDGKLTPEQLKDAYRAQGYSFLLFSDHNTNTNFCAMNDAGFVAIQGFEGQLRQPPCTPHKEFHLLFLKTPDSLLGGRAFSPYAHLERIPVPLYTGDRSLVEYIEAQRARGYMAIFNHPHWSFNDQQDLEAVKDLVVGMELYNHGCEVSENTGHAVAFYDLLLRRGQRLLGFATDDNHNLEPLGSAGCDSFGGFVVVKAASLTEESLLEAICAGSFYSSQGPRIDDFYIEDGRAVVHCSPARRVYLTNQARHYRLGYSDDSSLTCHSAPVDSNDRYIRAEVVDAQGRKAYSNPIWL